MKSLSVLGLIAAVISIGFAAPTSKPDDILPPEAGPQYFLRTFAPEQPWHGRHIVLLPSSQQLGLENFTVHPTTPPITFAPISLSNSSSYALALPGGSDELTQKPWIAAFKNLSGRTASFGSVISPDANDAQSSCPANVQECQANVFSLYNGQGGDASLKRLSFEGFGGGAFQASKDAPRGEGWHIYWRRNPDPNLVSIEFEVVPIERLGEEVSEY